MPPYYGPSSYRAIKTIFIGVVALTIIMMSQWARWRRKSPASRLFTQLFIQAQVNENIKAPRNWPLSEEFTVTGEFPAQRVSNAENVSIWWRHHVLSCLMISYSMFSHSARDSSSRNSPPACNDGTRPEVLSAISGSISSPLEGSMYPNRSNCMWHISVQGAEVGAIVAIKHHGIRVPITWKVLSKCVMCTLKWFKTLEMTRCSKPWS